MVEGGVNDIKNGLSAATTYANMQTACINVHAIGAKCVAGTVMASTTLNSGQETTRQALNASIISGYLSGGLAADAIADWGGNPILGVALNPGNTGYLRMVCIRTLAAI